MKPSSLPLEQTSLFEPETILVNSEPEMVSFAMAISQNAQEPFDGVTYQDKDFTRLSGQLLRVFEVMKDGRWYGASQLCELANVSPLSITARIRDLRKRKFGSHTIERKLIIGGYHEYRLVV